MEHYEIEGVSASQKKAPWTQDSRTVPEEHTTENLGHSARSKGLAVSSGTPHVSPLAEPICEASNGVRNASPSAHAPRERAHLSDSANPSPLIPLSPRERTETLVGLGVALLVTGGLGAAIVCPSPLKRLPPWDLIPLILLPLLWSVGFSLFALRSLLVGMRRTPRLDKIAESPYLPRVFLEFGYATFTVPIGLCARLGVSPNHLTYASLIITFLSAWAFASGRFALGGWALFFAFMLDAWDGILARKTNRVTTWGAFLDSTIDRYNDLVVFLGIAYYYRNRPLPALLCAAAMVGSTVVSYARAKGAALGHDPNVGYMQRHERAVWLGTGAVLAPIVAAFVEPQASHPLFHTMVGVLFIVAITTNITAIWRIRVVMRWLMDQKPSALSDPRGNGHGGRQEKETEDMSPLEGKTD